MHNIGQLNRGSRMKKSRGGSLATSTTGQEAGASVRSLQGQSYHGNGGEAIRIFDGTRMVTVGTLYPDGEFHKRLKPEHILRTPPAIAIQADAVEALALRGCVRIVAEIIDGDTLVCTFATFQQQALFLNRGFGEQYALPLMKWRKQGEAVQGSLFGEVV